MAFVAISCAGQPSDESCTATAAMPLFFGSSDPSSVSLNAEQRAAIGAIHLDGDSIVCSATVIADGWALTAAHCALGPDLVVHRSGEFDPTFRVSSTIAHPELDAMLIELQALKDVHIQPIPLWEGVIDESWNGESVTLAGLGLTQTGGTGDLFFVDETVIKVNADEVWVDGMGRSGACHGDSGGPMLVSASNGEARVAGVLDRGSSSCTGIDVYTRADVLREWAVQSLPEASASSCPPFP